MKRATAWCLELPHHDRMHVGRGAVGPSRVQEPEVDADTFATSLRLRAALPRVRAAALAPETWLPSWRHLRTLEVIAAGDQSGLGRRYRTTVRAAAPYSLRWEMEVVRAGHQLLVWRASGDLVGAARWELDEAEGITRIDSTWTVRPTPRWMVLLWPVARRWFVRNHDVLVERGARHLADRLGAELIGEVLPRRVGYVPADDLQR